MRNYTHRRCRPRCKPTWQDPTAPDEIPKAVPAGAAAEDGEHWFDFKTILTLPEPVATFGDAADAVYQYPTRAACREHSARLARGRGALHCLEHDARPDRIAGLPGDDGRTDLCPVKALAAWLAVTTITEGPALPVDLTRAFAAPSEGRQVEASASTLSGWLRRFDRTDRPEMDRARRV